MSSARNHSLVPHTTGDTQYNVRDAALRGASLAFAKPSPKPKPQVNTYTGGNNGALLAATKVGTPVKGDYAGGSSRSTPRPSQSPLQAASKSNSANSLRVSEEQFDRAPSPSNIAARLAAARYSPLRPASQASIAKTAMSERHMNERDVLPPSGSVGNVLARLDPKRVDHRLERKDSAGPVVVRHSKDTIEASDKPTDDTSIPPTTTLVKMFEHNRPVTPTNPPTAPLHVTRSSPPPVRSPKPQRAFKLPPEPKPEPQIQRVRTRTPPPVKPELKPRIQLPPARSVHGNDAQYFTTKKDDPMKSPPIKQKPIQLAAIKTTTAQSPRQRRPSTQDGPRSAGGPRRLSASIESSHTADSPVSFKSAKEQLDVEEKPKPSLPPPRRSNTKKTTTEPMAYLPKPTPALPIKARNQSQNPSAMHSPDRFSPPRGPASSAGTSPSVYHKNYQRESVKEITKHMTGESLSNAIMGAALAASSRNVSPAPRPMSVEPLFPPRKHHHHHSPFHRSPSPQKSSPPKSSGKMRTTMRQEPSSSDEEDEAHKYKKKGSRIMGIKQRKHPNKHHEAERKRWRDQITERERKRYEGVWAANKGIFLPGGSGSSPTRTPVEDDPSLDVLSLLVREIWTRSRLPTHVLEEVWDLVDGRGIGRLTRYEFVVGLWLIDQRLKGRKLPTRVSDSVWQSATGIGLKVKVHR